MAAKQPNILILWGDDMPTLVRPVRIGPSE
jgi:hypothetical protein